MRVTQYSAIEPYQRALEEINTRAYKEQTRISTGNNIVSISDSPKDAADVKQFNFLISNNKKYQDNLTSSIGELQTAQASIENIADKLMNIRDMSIDATQISNTANMRTFANYVKGFLTDIVTDANTDFNGHFLFAGTKTTKNSITPTGAQKDNMPFEIVQDTPSVSNPSGLRVDFKGNNNERIVNKGGSTTEVLNTKSTEIFGSGGTEVLNDLVSLYNLLKYKSDGTERGDNDIFTPEDTDKLNNLQKKITDSYDVVNKAAAQAGARQNRLESLNDQLVGESTRLKAYLSNIKDTNYTEAAINLAKEQNTLQFALQAGTHIMQQSLFDFLK